MKKLLYLLSAFCLSGYSQTDVEVKCAYAEIVVADTLYLSGYFENVRIESPHAVTVTSDLTTLTANLYPDYPFNGTSVLAGEIYNYSGELVQVVQSHNITHYNPHDVPALFSFYREDTGTLEWMENEVLAIGDIRTYQGVEYEVIQAHMSLSSWYPTAVLGVLFAIVSNASNCDDALPWNASHHWTTYKLGDLRVNGGSLWEVINVGFTYYEPSGANGRYGWLKVEDCP